jgi:hypothetical protein
MASLRVLGAEQAHPEDVQLLPGHVDLSHVDDALQSEEGAGSGRGDAMLTGSGLGDDAPFAHTPGDDCLPDGVVDLVRAGVVEIFALQEQPEIAAMSGKSLCFR